MPNTAKLWASLTGRVVDVELETDIPDSDHFFPLYGPDFQLEVTKGCGRNRNSQERVEELIKIARCSLDKLGSHSSYAN